MIPRREHKKRPGKALEQRARHVAYQRFYDAHKAIHSHLHTVVEAFGVEYTLGPYYDIVEQDGYKTWKHHCEGLVIIRLNKGVVLAETNGRDFDSYRIRLTRAWYLTNKQETTPPPLVPEEMVLAHVESVRFLREIPDGEFKSACTPYLSTP